MININESFHKKYYISNDINSYTNSRYINIDKNMNNINSIQKIKKLIKIFLIILDKIILY